MRISLEDHTFDRSGNFGEEFYFSVKPSVFVNDYSAFAHGLMHLPEYSSYLGRKIWSNISTSILVLALPLMNKAYFSEK
ncbi:hypothetical protein KA107_00055 [Candidatus Pacearchaeota archaeon]|nr:hypothetical protein [Candidatus Pacearchaeota archaeon]